jgi:small subunit ribosomal protein S16
VGSKKNAIWRVVVADQRSPRDGRFIETIGHYNPQTEPSTIRLDQERLQHWLARGAQPTGSVKQLVKAYAKSGGAPSPDGVTQVAAPTAEAPAPADAGEGSPESAAPGEPAPGAGEQVEADPEAAAAERAEAAGSTGAEASGDAEASADASADTETS